MTKHDESAPQGLFSALVPLQQFTRTTSTRSAIATRQLAEVAVANAAAILKSGRVLQAGLDDIRQDVWAAGREYLATLADDVTALASLRNPVDVLRFNEQIVRRNAAQACLGLIGGCHALGDLAAGAVRPVTERTAANIAALRAIA